MIEVEGQTWAGPPWHELRYLIPGRVGPSREQRPMQTRGSSTSPTMDLVTLIRGTFYSAALSILIIKFIPLLRDRFLAYGSRASGNATTQATVGKDSLPGALKQSLDVAARFTVPHSWFTSFYVVSVLSSLIWAAQLIGKGSLFQTIASYTDHDRPSMTLDQVSVTWLLMFSQAGRRLYECLTFSKPSSARMWIGHWALGIFFYLAMSIAVWTEAIPTVLAEDFTLDHIAITGPSVRTFISVLLFLFASGIQHDCHAYLGSLKKYSMPDHPVFQRLVCPHYTAECVIYLSLAILAAPTGKLLNWTIISAMVSSCLNLASSALKDLSNIIPAIRQSTHHFPGQHISEVTKSLTPALQLLIQLLRQLDEFAGIDSWYSKITPDHEFIDEIIHIIAHCTRGLEQRLRKVDLEALLLDDLPAVLLAHSDAYRTAHSGIYSAAFGPGTRELYHTIHPHPALSPVPTDDIASAEQLENEAAWRQLLIQGVLALILPPEHLENPCLRVLVGEIFSELILGNGICGKACEGWLIWELITKSIQVARFKGEDPLRVVEALPVNRLERFGLLSSEKTARAAAGPRMGARGPVAFAFGIFSAVIYYATLHPAGLLEPLNPDASNPPLRSRTDKDIGPALSQA
ncbi:hypothetical protein M8818_002867 [Zalaria obscura]|uniref:Uncharacterized protein n=1 Tax=Zalaria obscura TaxID=2024903 RepID=A0ACC3SI46_9PEZI